MEKLDLKGTINIKTINGREYFIHQYREDGKMKNTSLSPEDGYDLAFKINYSKNNSLDDLLNHSFSCEVNYGKSLYTLFNKCLQYKHRFSYQDINDFLYAKDIVGKVLIMFGLRRTGKTTLIFQNIASMSLNDFASSAYIKVRDTNTYFDLDKDLNYLTNNGFRFIFIDEATLLKDFINLSSSIADIYGTRSKIVLSGTDSLGFVFAKYNELYDRCIFVHTTYIPFREFDEVLNIHNLDTYIEYGGTMSIGGVDYNNQKILDGEHTNEYVDAAIAHNIEHSLKYFESGEHFSSLYELYKNKELTNVINRIIEDRNHRFALEVIHRDFRSQDYGSLKDLLLKHEEANELAQLLNFLDGAEIDRIYQTMLSIISKEEQKIDVDEKALKEIDEYLSLLDVVKTIDEIRLESMNKTEIKVVTQLGLRYAQAKALLETLLNHPRVKQLGSKNIKTIKEKLISDVKGRMMEEIILYETKYFNPDKEVFKLIFSVGEIDMVILDNEKECVDLYEIKYSTSINKKQYRHLINDRVNEKIAELFYPIKNRYVIYNGENQEVDGIKYINAVEYLTKST